MKTLKTILLIALIFLCLKCKYFTNEYSNHNDANADASIYEILEDTSNVNNTPHLTQKMQNPTYMQVEDTIQCNIIIVRETNRNINNLEFSDVALFLQTFSEKCRNNVEYSEFSNEVLFKVLEAYPVEIIKCFDTCEKIEINFILSELSNPIHDINITKIIEILNNVECESKYKAIIIALIEKAT